MFLGAMIAFWVFLRSHDFPGSVRSDRPLSVAEARTIEELSHGDFPDSAGNIRFAFFSQGVAVEGFVRFEAPVADCLASAERLLSDYNTRHPNTAPIALSRLAAPVDRRVAKSAHLTTDWFDVQMIKNGMEGGQAGHKVPKAWVDLDRGVLYYKLTD